jgi:hypothetical protein
MRIKIIRVNNEEYYKPSQANNLGVNFATGDKILRVDTDYFFNPYYNFFEYYKVDEKSFVSGVLEDQNTDFNFLYGLLYIHKENFNKVNGYNENIGEFYSNEDGDLFERLRLSSLEQFKLKTSPVTVLHIPHPYKKRYEHFEGHQNSNIENEICQNLSLHYSGEELQHQVEYGIAQRHCIINKERLNYIKEQQFTNTQWNIQQINLQYFVATKKKICYNNYLI